MKKDKKEKTSPLDKALSVIGWIIGIIVLFWFIGYESRTEIACTDATADEAADIINENYGGLGVNVELRNSIVVSQSEGYIKCKADSNIGETIYYTMTQKNEDVYIEVFRDTGLLNILQNYFN